MSLVRDAVHHALLIEPSVDHLVAGRVMAAVDEALNRELVEVGAELARLEADMFAPEAAP